MTPRHVRALRALQAGPVTREDMDRIAGASNSPDEVFRLRRKYGLMIPCERRKGQDRDRRLVDFGVYHLVGTDHAKVAELLQGVDQ